MEIKLDVTWKMEFINKHLNYLKIFLRFKGKMDVMSEQMEKLVREENIILKDLNCIYLLFIYLFIYLIIYLYSLPQHLTFS